MTERLRTFLILLALFLATWLPRVVGLEHFVTIDERKWLARSANFYQAVAHADWANTFQREHPGVTVMWAGALALLQEYPTYAQDAPGQFAWEREYFETWITENTPYTPLALLAAGRRLIVLLISLAIALGFLPLRRLLGATIAAVATLFVAWDPFAIAMSQQLHPDGFVSVFTLLALLLFLAWLYGGRHLHELIASGIVMGLAWLTKTPAIFLVPTGAALIGVAWWRGRNKEPGSRAATLRPAQKPEPERTTSNPPSLPAPQHPFSPALLLLRSPLVAFVLWGAIATLTFVALWPAMWVAPLGTLMRMSAEMGEYVERHTSINYFWGQPVNDPGLFFYPVAFLWRTTPAVLIGLVGAGFATWRRLWPLDDQRIRQCALGLLAFAVILAVGMTVGAKKFDRYLLPAFPALDIIAALGWCALGKWALARWGTGVLERWGVSLQQPQEPKQRRTASRHAISQFLNRYRPPETPFASLLAPYLPISIAVVAALLLHGLLGWLHFPYYLTYYNPLVGGTWSAPHVLFVGWGEGLDEAARWLDRQPDAEDLRVVTWYSDGPFSYFFRGQSVDMGASSPLLWLDTDYTVLYVNQWQRQLPTPEAIAYFLGRTPVYTVRSSGLDLAYIYDMRDTVLPDFVDIGKESAADFGGQIRLVAYDIPATPADAGDTMQVTFYLQSLAPMETNYNELVRLVGEDGTELWRDDSWPWGSPTKGWSVRDIRPDGRTVNIPADAKPGLYKFTLSFYDPSTFTPLPVTAVQSEQLLNTSARDVALLRVGAPPVVDQPIDPPWQFGDGIALIGATLPTQAKAGGELALRMDWSALRRIATDYTVFVHIVDENGENVAQEDLQPMGNFASTRLWTPGMQVVDRRAIVLPDDLAPGRYTVRVGLYTLDAGRLPVSRSGAPAGDYVDMGSFTVQ